MVYARSAMAEETEEDLSESVVLDRLPEVGETVESRWETFTLLDVVGVGGYGRVFRVVGNSCSRETFRTMALKAEVFSKAVLKNEIIVLKSAAAHHCKHMCKLFDYGHVGKEFVYLVMTLLGDDLYRLRRDRATECFSLATALRAAEQTLEAIEELHSCGFVSRDIKPGNFATGTVAENVIRHIYIFDFGLAKLYMKNKQIIPSRGKVGWRGTVRYGSVHAHAKLDLGRRDDVESWLYMIIEFLNGTLPWRYATGRSEVARIKVESRGVARDTLLRDCPSQFGEFLSWIDLLEFDSTPPYKRFYSSLNQILKTNNVETELPYDWEISNHLQSTPISSGSTELLTQMGSSEEEALTNR